MRDPRRIERMVLQLQEIWEKHPDMRLGQLIVNAVRPKEPCPEVYSIEDNVLEHRLDELSKLLDQRRNQDQS